MARILYPKHGGFQFYSLAEWSLADNDAQNQTKPVAGDTILLTANSAQVLCNDAWAAASLSHLGVGTSEWQFSGQIAEVGTIVLDKIVATIEAANIIAANFDLGTAGSLTSSDDFSVMGDFLLDGGTINTTDDIMTLDGDALYSSGTVTLLNLKMTGTSNTLGWSTASPLNSLEIASGATITSAADVWTMALAGAGDLVMNDTLEFSSTAAGFWTYTGQVTGTGMVDFRYQSSSPGSTDIDIDCTGGLGIRTNATHAMTFGAGLDCNAKPLKILGTGAGDLMTVNMATFGLTCGAMSLGDSGATSGSGVLNMGSGIFNVASIIMGNDANTGNVLAFDTSSVFLTGTIDGNSEDTNPMTMTSTGANLHGGTLLDVAVSGPLHCWGVTNSGVISVDVLHEGSNAGAALGGMQSMMGVAA